jgi:autophagy-related protein 11
MRDHIAESDGDRAVLEHQTLTLTKQLEELRVASDERLGTAKNFALRESNGLKAELSLTKAQLKDVQRREMKLVDELAMAKDNAAAMTSEKGYQLDVSRDAVALVAKYHEACSRLQNLINTSSTISGAASTLVNKVAAVEGERIVSDDLRESTFIKSLESASNFDLGLFGEAVQKTVNLVKKFSRSCKIYRDSARNKISFANFGKGDLASASIHIGAIANSTLRPSSCPRGTQRRSHGQLSTVSTPPSWKLTYSVSAPHNFLKVTEAMQNQVSTREYIIARILRTDEAIATGGEVRRHTSWIRKLI